MNADSLRFANALAVFADGAIGGGQAYLNIRLHAIDEAHLMLQELRRLDPHDHIGGALLMHVLERRVNGAAEPVDYPMRGWNAVATGASRARHWSDS